MHICFFGSYNQQYSRNILTQSAFQDLKIKVVECNSKKKGLLQYFELISKFIKIQKNIDIIFLPVLAHYHVIIAWILAKCFRKKLIADTFFSLYDTYVLDRETTEPFGLLSLRLKFYDFMTGFLPDKIIFDTSENANYFVKKYYVNSKKVFILPVSAKPGVFKAMDKKEFREKVIGFMVVFYPFTG